MMTQLQASFLYSSHLLIGKLADHLNQVDREANERFELLIKQMGEKHKIRFDGYKR